MYKKNKRRNYRAVIKKAFAVLLAGLFLFNSLPVSAGGDALFSSKNTLAPESRLPMEAFKTLYKNEYVRLTDEATNGYIGEVIEKAGGIDNIDKRSCSITRDGGKDIQITVMSIPGLLKNRGQFAHVGKGRWNNMPVIYVDSKFFFDRGALKEASEAILAHDYAEIRDIETEREARGLSFKDMTEAIKADLTLREMVRGFHSSNPYSLDQLYAKLQYDNPDEAYYVDLDTMYKAYLAYGAVLDRDDTNVNVAAGASSAAVAHHPTPRLYKPTIQVYRDKDRLGENVGEDISDTIAEAIRNRGEAVLVMPTGSTPLPVYDELVAEAWYKEVDLTKVTIFMMDEYVNGIDYATFITENFIKKLPPDNRPRNVYVLRGSDERYDYLDTFVTRIPIEEYESRLKDVKERLGGVDLVLGGIGVEGHVAFNEKGSGIDTRARVITLSPSTILANSEAMEKGYTHAMSIGLANILEAKKVVIIATGPKKGRAVWLSLNSRPSADVPASWLRTHPNVTFAMDWDTDRAMNYFRSAQLVKFSAPNIRTEKEGYKWGAWYGASRILGRVFASQRNRFAWEAFRDAAGRKPRVDEATAEYWLASDDKKFPSQIDIGGPRLTAMRDWLESSGIYLLRLKVKDIPFVGGLTRAGRHIWARLFPKSKLMIRLRNLKVFAPLEKFLNGMNIFLLRRPPASFRDLLEAYPEEMLGKRHVEEYGPHIATVMKVIDARETLSVGVHPRADNKLGLPGRPEHWKVLEPSSAWFGWNQAMTHEKIRNAVPKPYVRFVDLTTRQRANLPKDSRIYKKGDVIPMGFEEMTPVQRRIFYLREWDHYLSMPGQLTEFLNLARFEKDDLADVPGGVVHALRGRTFISEWSRAPAKKEMDPLADSSNLALASVGTEDRGDKEFPKKARAEVVKKPDGDLAIFPKEEVDRTLRILDDAKQSGFDPYAAFDPNDYRFKALTLDEFEDGNITVATLFQTPNIVVEEMRFKPGAVSALKIEEYAGRGYPIFVEKGAVSIYNKDGIKLGTVREFHPAFIPAYLASKIYIRPEGGAEVVMQRWFAPFADERKLIKANSGKRTADLSGSRMYDVGMPGAEDAARALAVEETLRETSDRPVSEGAIFPSLREIAAASAEQAGPVSDTTAAPTTTTVAPAPARPSLAGTPAKFLGTIQRRPELMAMARSKEGFALKDAGDIRGMLYYRHEDDGILQTTVYRELKLLRELGIIIKCDRPTHYRFSDMMIGMESDNANYTTSLIDVIKDISYKRSPTGKEEKPLQRGDIPKGNINTVRNLIQLHVVNFNHTRMKDAGTASEPCTIKLWRGYGTAAQQSFMTGIEQLTRNKPYRISFENSIRHLAEEACDRENVNDRTVTIMPLSELRALDTDFIKKLKESGARVIFVDMPKGEFGAYSLAPLDGLIAAGKAYLNNDEDAFYRLRGLLAAKADYEHVSLAVLKENPVLFIEKLKFILKPITARNVNELEAIRERMEKLLQSA